MRALFEAIQETDVNRLRSVLTVLDGENIGEKALYEEWLNIISGKKVKISYVKSTKGKELQALADKNSRVILDNAKLSKMTQIRDDFNYIGSYLKEKLHLNNFPYRIE